MNIGEVKISELRQAEPFNRIFMESSKTVSDLAKSMREIGFDPAFPVITWNGVIVDGHQRIKAAKAAKLKSVYYVDHQFADEAAALRYAIDIQRNRRNLTDAEILRCVAELDKRMTKAEAGATAHEQTQDCVSSGPSSATTAAAVGISPRKVEQVRTVLDHAAPEVKEAVETGNLSINAAYRATQEARNPVKSEPTPGPEDLETKEERIARWVEELKAVAQKKPRSQWADVAYAMREVANWITTENCKELQA